MWRIIAAKEIRAAFSNHVFIVLGLIIWSLLAVACIGGLENFRTARKQRLEATTLFKNELAEKERNPHSAAHFGTYLFKPLTSLSLYDPGVNSYTGISYRVEAHKQSEMSLASVQDSDGVIRFGELSVASIFQLLVPLVIIFLSFSSVSKERQDGTFKILLSQGLSLRALVWGKIAGNYVIILVVIFPCLAFILIKGLFSSESYVNVSLFAISYLLYFLIFTVFSVCTSFVCKSSGTSLLVLLGAWMWFCVISPKITAGIASSEYPLQSYYEFSKLVDHDFYNGMDNDGSYEERRKKFEAGVLDKYKVDWINRFKLTPLRQSKKFPLAELI
ncbi:ABC transporter permease [Pedobacter jejuensis]|uniref:ABC transporter permease n=1 Tax=Pedobacter jejuensis TaxID=1268550 RepID=A0A3N0BY40_9SPHI|nr:ABC transporter permease [Pedobacter jejuensis]RNL54630.1 ABC transporter permease [Pedobacter jejuensis]